jgi:hypothetical protein
MSSVVALLVSLWLFCSCGVPLFATLFFFDAPSGLVVRCQVGLFPSPLSFLFAETLFVYLTALFGFLKALLFCYGRPRRAQCKNRRDVLDKASKLCGVF